MNDALKIIPKRAYAERMNDVCQFIMTNLQEDLTLEKISTVASFSKYHFHRQFVAFHGVTLAKYIVLMRLKRASYQLVFNENHLIIDIAMDAMFENPESFSRAFKKLFSQTPSQFRKDPKWDTWNEKYKIPVFSSIHCVENLIKMKIEIIDFPETKIAVLAHRGHPDLINDSVSHFIQWRKESQLSPITTENTYGLAYDDPKTTESESFRFDICGSVKSDVPKNTYGIVNKIMPGGRCAVVRHLGSHEAMGDIINYLYCEWLPKSNEELRDFPCYFHFINLFPEVAEHELITDIYLPLK